MTRILVVDDDIEIREMLRTMLERAGYDVLEAANGNLAIGIYRREAVDLIITDLIMPEKEGIEMIMELCREHPGIKIIAMSGGARVHPQSHLDMARALGARHVFTKPFGAQEMIRVVRELVDE